MAEDSKKEIAVIDITEEYLKENPKDIVKFKKYPKQSQKKAV